ncbi:MAG: 2-C-methyl-D-erythritol 4-phosphate cytidylyltransferase [Pseudomonadales bacterium]|nr:2-C-methyl-D-erythritol 4-phosphate cytidylyltransferase [Pseudomonadales bacterium]
MSDSSRYWCIVPAAGVGKRMGGPTPKQYLTFPSYPPQVKQSVTVLETTLNRLIDMDRIEKVVVALAEDDPFWPTLNVASHPKIEKVLGGAERCHSVLNGLLALEQWAADDDWVLVHDVARPCVRTDDIELLIRKVKQNGDGGVLGYSVRDTMKRTDSHGCIIKTVERNHLWHALTPQMFRLRPLLSAIQASLKDGVLVTDESAAMERAGVFPIMVEGAPDNIKITRPEDLTLAGLFLRNQRDHD